MCAICDGQDLEEFVEERRDDVDTLGWTVVGVGRHRRSPGWVYSIGLSVNFDHPELVLVGATHPAAYAVLHLLAHEVEAGRSFSHHDSTELADLRFRFGWVHPRHFQLGTFAGWNLVLEGRTDGIRPRALQVIAPRELMRTPRRWRLTEPRPLGR
jgi:hypothetical protein